MNGFRQETIREAQLKSGDFLLVVFEHYCWTFSKEPLKLTDRKTVKDIHVEIIASRRNL